MMYRFTRRELYDLVWSEPMTKLALRLGASDVWVAKACRHADIPVPERGYWARLQAGKTVMKQPLSRRGLGMSDTVVIGRDSYQTREKIAAELLAKPIEPPPPFAEDMSQVAERVRKMVGKVRTPATFARVHPLIARLLDEDQRRREQKLASSFPLSSEDPLYDSPSGRRYLRILKGLFLGLQRCGFTPWVRKREAYERGVQLRGRQAYETGVQIGHRDVAFTLDGIAERRRPSAQSATTSGKGKAWEDTEGVKIEHQFTDIVVELIVTGEASYRAGVQAQYEWCVKRKAELEEEARRRREEEERQERERLAKLEKQRVERLFNEVTNRRRANDLRTFVEAVRVANRAISQPRSMEQCEQWAASALADADRIDPIVSGRFRFQGGAAA